MPEMFMHGIRKGQSAEDITVGQARTRVFQQSDFYKANFLNNPDV